MKFKMLAIIGTIFFVGTALAQTAPSSATKPLPSNNPVNALHINSQSLSKETSEQYQVRALQAYINELNQENMQLRGEIVQLKIGSPPQSK